MNIKTNKNTINRQQYLIALSRLRSYKTKYKSFKNVKDFTDKKTIDFLCEKIAKYRQYELFFPELIEKKK